MTFDGHRGGDYATYVFTTTDFGNTWRSIASNLPKGEVARTIAEDRKNPDLLYLGTETGLWVSWNKGGQWTRLKANLPTIPIYEIKTHPRDNDMILATHARGIWILDDLGIVQQWAKSEAAAAAYAFEPDPALAFNAANDQMKGFEGDRLFLGHESGAGRDAGVSAEGRREGREVDDSRRRRHGRARDRRRRDEGSQQGGPQHREVGPARRAGQATAAAARHASRRAAGGGGGFFGATNNGPFVLPGTYRAALSVDGKEVQTVNVAVTGDPDIKITDADRKVWFDTAMDLQQLQQQGERRRRDGAERQRPAPAAAAADAETRPSRPTVKQSLDNMGKEMEIVRRRLGLGGQGGGGGFGGNPENVRGRIGQLKGAIIGSTSVPTTTQLQQIREAKAALPGGHRSGQRGGGEDAGAGEGAARRRARSSRR